MRSIRVWFTKKGAAKYTSHLDMNRCMLRAVNRARLPVWYTEGFNPHPYITFALPLSLGIESEGEPMDMRIEGDMTNEEVKNRLADVMPNGMDITAVTDVVDDAKIICYAEYEMDLAFNTAEEATDFCEKAKALVQEDTLTAEKTVKQGRNKVTKEVLLKDLIATFTAESVQDRVVMNTVLSAGNSANLNPNLLLDALLNKIEATVVGAKIVRKRLLKADFEIFM